MAAYVPTTWVNGQAPALSAANLNKLTDELEAQAAAKSISHSLPTWADGVAPALTDAAPLNEMERVVAAISTALGLNYISTVWSQGWVPSRNASRLNNLELAVRANRAALDAPSGTPIFTADFETGDFSQVQSQQESSPGRIALTSGVSWGGNYTARVLCGPPDQGVAGAGGSYRTEMALDYFVGHYGWPSLQGRHTWITWDMLFETGFEFNPTWLLTTQFWTQGLSTGSPCFAINSPDGIMYIVLRGGNETNSNERYVNLGAVPVNTKLSWKVHHLWASGSGGLVEVWRNGIKVVNGDTLPNSATGYDSSVEFKTGIYRGGGPAPTRDSALLVDNIKFWTSDPGTGY